MKRVQVTYNEIAPGDFIVPPPYENNSAYLTVTGLVISVSAVEPPMYIKVSILDWKRGVTTFTAYLDAFADVLR